MCCGMNYSFAIFMHRSAVKLCIAKIKPFILQYLKDANLVDENTVTKPNEVEHEDLLLVHTAHYLKSLKVNLKYCC